jgi:hypothetical protein
LSGNTASSRGGGIYTKAYDGTDTRIEDTTVSGNYLPGLIPVNGGGIYGYVWDNSFGTNIPKFTITGSTVDNNRADMEGGGMFFCAKDNGIFIAANSTFSGNATIDTEESEGGGLLLAHPDLAGNSVDAFLRNVTVTQNISATGGGVAMVLMPLMRVRIANSIISENFELDETTPNNLFGPLDIDELKYNLIGSGSSVRDFEAPSVEIAPQNWNASNITNEDMPFLGPLQNNGGRTPTHALLYSPTQHSPAIDHGSDDLAAMPLTGTPEDPLTTDQRGTGFARIFDVELVQDGGGGTVDIGAYEEGMNCVYVSTTTDEFDQNLSIGDVSLREAVDYANNAGVPTTICLPEGEYQLTITGTGGINQGDLDVTGNVTIIGEGAGVSIVKGLVSGGRIFDVANASNVAALTVSWLTLSLAHGTSNSDQRHGGAIRVQNGEQLHMDNSAVVGNESGGQGYGGGIYFAAGATGSIESSVITANWAENGTGGLYLADGSGTVTIESTIIANNGDDNEETEFPDIYVGAGRTLDSLGYNRFTSATEGSGFDLEDSDDVGTVDYVVTSIADTYSGSADLVKMSLRDAIHQANITAGLQEIWLPAWDFVLTRARTDTQTTDTDVSFGDLDIGRDDVSDGIDGSLTIRGINGLTSVGWAGGLPNDEVFDFLGDYNDDGFVETDDFIIWGQQEGQPGSGLAADGDEDGDVDDDDKTIWIRNQDNILVLDL